MALTIAACRFPADPEGTTDEVEGAVLKVGELSELGEADQQAVALVAYNLSAEVRISRGDPHTLFNALEEGRLHLIAGALPMDTPFAKDVALTRPVGKLERDGDQVDQVLAVRQGENAFLIRVDRAIKGMQP
ncbi:enoyl-CoA hydratase [Paracoccus albicereus]|uniref:enoyl-CoA hydratase n=1 Tax=Paracoccus albicereus TaxID=2922394 RepID=UPI00210190A5|nr:enoyl-CoA hydratase [Paracoccus albicereus]